MNPERRKAFAYLAGNKIGNYWLNVLEKYADIAFADRERISAAVEPHVLQASVRLGLITWEEAQGVRGQVLLAQRWEALLHGSGLAPVAAELRRLAVEI